MSEFVTVARLSDFGERNALRVTANGREIALFRFGGVVYALNDQCPHKGGPLSMGWVEEGNVFCPLHGWKFSLDSGACETNCERPVPSHEVRIVNGEVQVRVRA